MLFSGQRSDLLSLHEFDAGRRDMERGEHALDFLGRMTEEMW